MMLGSFTKFTSASQREQQIRVVRFIIFIVHQFSRASEQLPITVDSERKTQIT